MKPDKKKKLGNTLKTIAGLATKFIVPGGSFLENVRSDNDAPIGKYDQSRTWPDVALELGKIVLYALALHYLGIELPI